MHSEQNKSGLVDGVEDQLSRSTSPLIPLLLPLLASSAKAISVIGLIASAMIAIRMWLVLLSLLLTTAVWAEERTWTNTKGATLTAEFVEVKGSTVVLRTLKDSKQFAIDFTALSASDQTYIQQEQQTKAAELEKQRREKLAGFLGLRQHVPIVARRWENWQDYYKKSLFGQAMLDFFAKERSIVDYGAKGLFVSPEHAVRPPDYAPTMVVYCPESYDGQMKMGVYIHIQPRDAALVPSAEYKAVMDTCRLIFASTSGAGNDQADMRRIALALDALAQLRKDYTIDETRVYAGGVSGGGAESVFVTLSYPEDFRGCVDAVRNFQFLSSWCFPFAKESDVKKSNKYGQPLAFVTGPKDFNYQPIQQSIPGWKKLGFMVKMFDVPGMGHGAASGATLQEALQWLDDNNPKIKGRNTVIGPGGQDVHKVLPLR